MDVQNAPRRQAAGSPNASAITAPTGQATGREASEEPLRNPAVAATPWLSPAAPGNSFPLNGAGAGLPRPLSADGPALPCAADPDLWFSDDIEDQALAQRVCRACPAREACGKLGANGREWGIWGGTTERARVLAGHPPGAWPSRRPLALVPNCGTKAGYRHHLDHDQLPCPLCRKALRAARRDRQEPEPGCRARGDHADREQTAGAGASSRRTADSGPGLLRAARRG